MDFSSLVGTDDQNLTGATLTGNSLQIDIEGGSSTTVDLSSLVGTDDQIANEVNITDAAGNFTATEVEGALAELAAGSTDDQNIESLGVDVGTNILTVGIEDGTSQTVDLSHLDDSGTDDQNIEGLALSGANVLTVGIEDGTSQTVDLSSLVGTDDQIAYEVNITDAAGNFTATEVEGALAELAAGSTDDQNLTGATLTGNSLQIDIEGGSSTTVDLSSLVGTDDQIANEVNITDAAGNFTATEVEGALAELAAGSTDDQNIESLGVDVGTNILTVGIEDGTSQTVDLSHLDDSGTDDQIASEVNITDAAGNFTATEVEGALAELAAGSTDDQQLDDPNTLFNAGTNELTDSLGGWRNGNS